MTEEECRVLLLARGESLGRLPKKSDFTPEEVVFIKARFGPWPRALEAAGLKEPREDGRAEKTKERRIRAKRARREGAAGKGEKNP